MLKILKFIFGIFSPYVNSFERRVDRFFKSVKSNNSRLEVSKKLLDLMKENLIVVNVWMEKKYKGYKYLNKRTRKKMYEDVLEIEKTLIDTMNLPFVREEDIGRELDNRGLKVHYKEDEKLRYIYAIMQFLKPGNYYHYIKTASFGKLLRNPNEQKLEGDCNQIVTLYIYLYSLKYSIEDLKIKLLPEHVCLHYKGVDIECTTGQFAKYTDFEHILPVTEIISTNLLDLTDFREDVQMIDPRVILKSSQLAFAISSLKQLVEKNLKVAYTNLAVSFLNGNNYDSAIFYLKKLGDKKKISDAYYSAAVHYMKIHNYKKSLFYADKSDDEAIKEIIKHNEGLYYYRKDQIKKALEIFEALGDKDMQKACYGKLYNQLAKKVRNIKTLEEQRRNKAVYKKMLVLAIKLEDNTLELNLKRTLDSIK